MPLAAGLERGDSVVWIGERFSNADGVIEYGRYLKRQHPRHRVPNNLHTTHARTARTAPFLGAFVYLAPPLHTPSDHYPLL